MNICIVTVYNSLNYGSYLQSYALCEVIKNKGHNVSFLETKARKPVYQTVKSIVRYLIKMDFSKVKFHVIKLNKFNEANNKFRLTKYNHKSISDQDLFVFGSDEIWNISRDEFRKYPIFWGAGISNKPKISYAVSINTTKPNEIISNQDFIEGIKKFTQIAVRDMYTKITLNQALEKNVKLVLDPTFLLDKSFYSNIEEKCKKDDFILVYSYGQNMNKNIIGKIVELSKKRNLKLVSVGFNLDWCHESIPASPFEFLGYLSKAKYVITDTFHGTVFSIIYNKQFVAYAGKNRKIEEILNQFDIEVCNADAERDLVEKFSNELNYDKINKLVEEFKQNSLEYIDSFLLNEGENYENSK